MTNETNKQKMQTTAKPLACLPHPYAQVLQWVAEGKEIEVYRKSGGWEGIEYSGVLNAAIHGVYDTYYIQPQDFRLKPQRHIHQELIDAWKNGAEIQWYCTSSEKWIGEHTPMFNVNSKYRIRQKIDTVKYAYIVLNADKTINISHWTTTVTSINNLRIVFDGETNKIKSVEII